MSIRTLLAATASLATLAVGAAAYAQPTPPPVPVSPEEQARLRKEFMKGYTEYDIPKSVYVPGDPFLLTDANKTSGKRLNFVACPIIRDSDPTPLWLTEYEGELYFLRAQQNFSGRVRHPQHLHQVLVEGVISNEPRIGGGIVLNPLNVSILPELDASCTKFLPSEGYKVPIAKRPPGPGSNGAVREGRNDKREQLRARIDKADWTPDPGVKKEVKEFIADFDFDSEMVWSYPAALEAAVYSRNVEAARIEVHGVRGSALLSNGKVINEKESIAETRAKKLEIILKDYNVQAPVVVTWDATPAKADGISDFSNRYVRIRVIPGSAKGQRTAAR